MLLSISFISSDEEVASWLDSSGTSTNLGNINNWKINSIEPCLLKAIGSAQLKGVFDRADGNGAENLQIAKSFQSFKSGRGVERGNESFGPLEEGGN